MASNLKKYLFLVAFTGFFVALDQLTKLYVHTQFFLHESVTVVEGFFNLTYIRNDGAAFGLFGSSSSILSNLLSPTNLDVVRNIFFLSMPPVAVVLIVALLREVPNDSKSQVCALSAVAGGALGNYADRLRLGYVVDFLDFHWKQAYSWPAFNVADVAIIVGISVLILSTILEARESV